MRRKRTPAKPVRSRKQSRFSLSFIIAVPAHFVLGALCLVSLVIVSQYRYFETQVWTAFASSFIGGIVIVGTSKIPRFRTFIHELKHALVVVLSGNRMNKFHVDTHTGHVSFEMYKDRLHFAPIITLAPYFLPFFSLPILIACLFLDNEYRIGMALLLGFALACDLSMGFKELHPQQTDLQNIFGGFFSAAAYLAGFHFMWVMICMTWILAGRSGFIHVGYLAYKLGELTIASVGSRFAQWLDYQQNS